MSPTVAAAGTSKGKAKQIEGLIAMLPKPRDDCNLSHALAYADLGWHIFPLRPRTKEPYANLGLYHATSDHQRIYEWWSQWPDANIGLHCGASGIVAIDEDAADALVSEGITLDPLTPTNLTADGQHLLYRQPDGARIGNQHRGMPEHVHVRGWGGYIVLPPSIHPDGPTYTWEHDYSPWDLGPAALPDGLLQRFQGWDNADTTDGDSLLHLDPVPTPNVNELRLPPSARDAIYRPAPRGRRSEQDASVVWHLLHTSKLTPSEVKAIYDTHPIGTKGKYAERGIKYLERTIANALGFRPAAAKAQAVAKVGPIIRDARYRVMHHEWTGRRASNARALMLAILNHLEQQDTTETHLSRRQMADLSGLGKATVSRIFSDQMLSPFLTVVQEHDGLRAPVYRLIDGNTCTFGTHIDTPDVTTCVPNTQVFPTTRLFDSETHELARQLSSLLADDAFIRNVVPEQKKRDVKHIYTKSFTHVGRDVIAYLATSGGRAPLSDVCAFIGTNPRAVSAAVRRMSDGLKQVGVDPIAWMETNDQDRRRKIVVLAPNWRSYLDAARPHLYTDGIMENRKQRHAIERYWRALRISDNTDNEDTLADALRIAEGAAKVYQRATGTRLTGHLDHAAYSKDDAA